MDAATTYYLSPLQTAILNAVARYEVSQARPVTVRDIYRRLRLEKNLVETTVRELADMGYLYVERITANNRLKVITIKTTEAGNAWIAQ